MFAFDISGLALEVAPPDTGRVRLVAVTSGLLEARPHEIGADFPDRVARGVWLRACSGGGGGNGDAEAYLNDVFDALQDPSDGRGDGGELRVAAALLSFSQLVRCAEVQDQVVICQKTGSHFR